MIKTLLVVCLMLIALPVWGANYYVDCGAGAGGDGSIGTPWDQLSDISGVGASNTIYLAKGCTWRETLTVPAAGITFNSYGTGAKPIISGGVLKNTSGDWTDEGSNLWYLASITADPGILLHDGTLGLKKTAKIGLTAHWHYWWDDPNDRLYVYSTANPTS